RRRLDLHDAAGAVRPADLDVADPGRWHQPAGEGANVHLQEVRARQTEEGTGGVVDLDQHALVIQESDAVEGTVEVDTPGLVRQRWRIWHVGCSGDAQGDGSGEGDGSLATSRCRRPGPYLCEGMGMPGRGVRAPVCW